MIISKRKTALVTGANSGIGLELTKKLIENGWEVAALIRSEFPRRSLISTKKSVKEASAFIVPIYLISQKLKLH